MVNVLFRDPKGFRGLFSILCLEAVVATAYDIWIGPSYLSGLAGQYQVSLTLVSILAAVPWIGASGQILGTWAFEHSSSVKRYVLWVAGIGRALWLVPLLLAAYWGWQSWQYGVAFPSGTWFAILAVSACATCLLTSASTNVWMYWMKSLVPYRFQGRFFGHRQRFAAVTIVGASLFAAALIEWQPGGFRIGAGLLCLLAIVTGIFSLGILTRVPDVPCDHSAYPEPRSFREIIGEPLKDPEFRRLLFFGAAFNGAMQLASSYFPYYFTHELKLPMSSVALWSSLANLGCFLSVGYWGRRVDRDHSTHSVLGWTGLIVAFSPLIYVIKSGSVIRMIAPFEYLMSGLAWAGFALAQTKLLMKACPRGRGVSYFSVFAAGCGLSGAVCTFLGGQLAQLLAPWGGFRLLWIIASVARFAVLGALLLPLLRSRPRRLETGVVEMNSPLGAGV